MRTGRKPVVTTEDANAIIETPKILAESIRWRRNHQHQGSFRFTAQLFAPGLDEPLDLIGNKGGRSWSFTLNYRHCRLRSLEVGSKAHRNPGNKLYISRGVIHKHAWTTRHRDQEAYIPTDIDASSIDAALRTFLGEVNVDLRSEIFWEQELLS